MLNACVDFFYFLDVLISPGVVNCADIQYQQTCGKLCVGESWFSKITFGTVNATKICIQQGYGGTIVQHGGNRGIQCKYPGDKFGVPIIGGGPLDSLGAWVSWKCELGKV